MEKRSAPDRQRRRQEAEHNRQHNHVRVPAAPDPITCERRDFIFEILLHPDIRSERRFGIVWNPDCYWASGPCIKPFAHIFDRFVGTAWKVSVVDDIDGRGTPGWVFERS